MNKSIKTRKAHKISLSRQTLNRLNGSRSKSRENVQVEKGSASWFLCKFTNKCDIDITVCGIC